MKAVAVPVASPSAESSPADSSACLKQLCDSYGFRQIGQPLPENVTLKDIINSLPKKVMDLCYKTTIILSPCASASMSWSYLHMTLNYSGSYSFWLKLVGSVIESAMTEKEKIVGTVPEFIFCDYHNTSSSFQFGGSSFLRGHLLGVNEFHPFSCSSLLTFPQHKEAHRLRLFLLIISEECTRFECLFSLRTYSSK